MSASSRRDYGRRYAQRRRARALEREQMRSSLCPRRAGSGRCGGVIETYIETGTGLTRVRCPFCERRKRGICRDCNAPVYGAINKSLRCARHAQDAKNASCRRWMEANKEHKRAQYRAHYHQPDVNARRNAYKRAWRKANPDKVRAQKRRYVDKHKGNPNSSYNRYHRRYRRKYQAHKREMERDRLRAAGAMRTRAPKCTRCGKSTRWRPVHRGYCGKPWTVCTKCLFPSERKIRMRNRRRALQRSKKWLESIPAPARIKRPPRAPEYGPGKERLCLGGCGRVLTHRKKKCTRCRERDAAIAAQQLAASRGRGRRTDLERVA